MRRQLLAGVVLVALVCSATAVDVRAEMAASAVEEALTCQCGCGLTVRSCNHLECSFAIPVRKDIAESLARGETGEQILDRYRVKYGEKVLSTPLAEGFNLLAWVAPYAAISITGVMMLLLFWRRVRRTAHQGADEAQGLRSSRSPASPELDHRRAMLRREVEDLEK